MVEYTPPKLLYNKYRFKKIKLMEIEFRFEPYYYIYDKLIDKAKHIGEELNEYLAGRCYISDLKLDEVIFIFINTQNMKCRVRPDYRKASAPMDDWEVYSLMRLYFEIPMPEAEFIKVSDEDRPTYIGKAIMQKLESQNVPTKIRKQFDRERFIADVRDFFVNVKGCKLD